MVTLICRESEILCTGSLTILCTGSLTILCTGSLTILSLLLTSVSYRLLQSNELIGCVDIVTFCNKLTVPATPISVPFSSSFTRLAG
jgi:hypothetical protein